MGKNKKFTKEHTRTFYNIKMAFIIHTNILFGYLRRRTIFDLWRNSLKLLSVVTRIVSVLRTWRRAGDKFIHTRRWYSIGDAARIINRCAKTDTVRGYDKHSAVVCVRGVCVYVCVWQVYLKIDPLPTHTYFLISYTPRYLDANFWGLGIHVARLIKIRLHWRLQDRMINCSVLLSRKYHVSNRFKTYVIPQRLWHSTGGLRDVCGPPKLCLRLVTVCGHF